MTDTPPLTIVTGSARGIGAATALHLAAAGHDLVLNALTRREEAERVADSARAAGASVAVVLGDVADESVADGLFAAAAGLGTVTGLVNNAGLTSHLGDLADTPVRSSAGSSR